MNNDNLSTDDPRLTAFALGELAGEEHTRVAAAVAADPALREEVNEIRATAGSLETALGAEPLPTTEQFVLIDQNDYPTNAKKSNVTRFPYYWVAGLAAAAFAVLVLVQDPESPMVPQEEVIRYTLDLGETPEARPEAAPLGAARDRSVTLDMPIRDGSEIAGREREQPTATRVTGLGEPPPYPLSDDGAGRMPVVAVEAVSESNAAPVESASANAPMDEDAVALSAFEVSAEESTEYATATTLAGARMTTELRDMGSANSVVTSQFLQDVAQSPRVASMLSAAPLAMRVSPPAESAAGEGYALINENTFQQVADNPLSTFSVDVDSASYANVRRFLNRGQLPPVDAVRIEELINTFSYDYAPPRASSDAPFAAHLEVASAPWAPDHRLVRIGLKGRELAVGERQPANLVFLLDVSGSMSSPQKLPLVKEAMRMLVGRLETQDRVAIVTYAGSSGLALPSTAMSERRDVLNALEVLRPGGSTNGSMGIHLAYDIAKANFVEGGINRVILCTDGDFNVGVTSEGELSRLIAEKARTGVFLTTLGFGMGNYQDQVLERLANDGNGAYGYIDSAREARRLLVEQIDGTLATIAKDVKVQVEFNPARVQAYRLIGYENRLLAKEDFNNDAVDAGEIGAGHTVTALYEIVPAGVDFPRPGAVDELRYQQVEARQLDDRHSRELLTVKVRAKLPDADESRRWEFPLVDRGGSFAAASRDFKFAAAVAGFGMELRGSAFKGTTNLDNVIAWAEDGLIEDPAGYRQEFIALVRTAGQLRIAAAGGA